MRERPGYEAMNNYVRTMRSMIGTKPLLICGASVIVIREGHILLQKRKDNGCWGYHGGCLELGERLEEAAVRELFEETGLKARAMSLYGIFSGPELRYVYPHGDEIFVVDTVYICDDFEGNLNADAEEVSELRWFPFKDVPENLSPPVSKIIREFIRQKLDGASEMRGE
jgi:8-oxo-dGTP pyrophosphatase MutT (NUDIX family)